MRKWGIVITVFYAVVVVVLLTPASLLVVEQPSRVIKLFTDFGAGWPSFAKELGGLYRFWPYWAWIGFLVGAQALLLFLSVDTSHRRLKPRRRVTVSIATTALLLAILTSLAILSLGAGLYGDDFLEPKIFLFGLDVRGTTGLIIFLIIYCLTPWMIWGILFYVYFRNAPVPVTRLMSWLLTGSVLELLIAVPSHILVRQRDQCSAPTVTGFGIVTGLAIMLLSFGPGVLLLYKKRLDQYKKTTPPQAAKA